MVPSKLFCTLSTVIALIAKCSGKLCRKLLGRFVISSKDRAPFFHNHVDYASTLSLFIPFIWFARHWYKKRSTRWWQLIGFLILFLVGVQFSYTRAAYVGIFGAIFIYYVIQWRLMKPTIAVSVVATLMLVATMVNNDRYLDFEK